MAVKIAYLWLALAATISSLQNAEADGSLIRKAEEITLSQNVVHKPLIKSVPLMRPRRSSAFDQIHANPPPGFRGIPRRSGGGPPFSEVGSSRQNGFVDQTYPGGFNNADPFGGAYVPVGTIGPDEQGYFAVVYAPSGSGNPANPGGFRNTPGGFRTAGGGFRTAGGGFRTAGGGFRTSGGGFRNTQSE